MFRDVEKYSVFDDEFMFLVVFRYVSKDFSEVEKNDLFASLSRKRIEESEVWLFQLPPEVQLINSLRIKY